MRMVPRRGDTGGAVKPIEPDSHPAADGGRIHTPRSGHPYFNTVLFSPNSLGTQGNAPSRPFYGPGVNNFDTELHKAW